jgi:hypothetical protein
MRLLPLKSCVNQPLGLLVRPLDIDLDFRQTSTYVAVSVVEFRMRER